LGDIIDSSPIYIGPPSGFYPDSLESVPYSSFRTAQAARTPMIYVGANDGMLHAINAASGVEQFAFIPGSVFGNLYQLPNQNYTHLFYVDGKASVIDAFYGGAWHSVLAAGLNKGGQGVYALDVTNPGITEANLSAFLWEFTDAQDADLGYTYSRPSIVRLHNGQWAAVFGNGYNNTQADGHVSTTGDAVLYIVDIQTGALIRKIDTMVGVSADPTGQGRPNGLATQAAVDTNHDGVIDYVYAGDLFGNLWKFNLTDPSPANWKVAYTVAGQPVPLFTAKDSGGKAQPITVRPQVGYGPGGSSLILFGTGKFLEESDRNVGSLSTQSLYGLYDPNTNTTADLISTRAQLVQQTIVGTTTVAMGTARVTSANPVNPGERGWYMDLGAGEMMVTDPLLQNGLILYTTTIPSSDICSYGGNSWLMALNPVTGGSSSYAAFDINGDKKFNDSDQVTVHNNVTNTDVTANVSGLQFGNGLSGRVSDASDSGGTEHAFLPETGDKNAGGFRNGITINGGPANMPRQSWRQIR
jgi:type IV pilus assembly protein PilY1